MRMPSWAEEMVAPVVGETNLLLHNQARHAHAHAGTENGQQPGQSGDEKNLQLMQVAAQQGGKI